MRNRLKWFAGRAASIAVMPRVISFHVWSAVLGRDRALRGSTQALARIPGMRGEYLRRAFLMHVIEGCHPTVVVCYGTVFSSIRAVMDENVYVGQRCHLGMAHLERDVLLGDGVHVPSGGHIHGTEDPDAPIREQPGRLERVRIGAGTWVGSASVVLSDVGRNCVIGAGSVVTKPIPDSVFAAGAPARVIRSRKSADQADRDADAARRDAIRRE